MPHSNSAKKRVRQNQKSRTYNRKIRSAVRTQMRRTRNAAVGESSEAAQQELRAAYVQLDRAATKGVMHRRTASRLKSRLARQIAKRPQAS